MLIRHSALYLLGRLIPGGVSLLMLALYTRLMTTEQYGHYALVIAGVGIVNAVCFQWLNLSLGRFLPGNKAQSQALLSTALAGFLILVAITGVFGGAAAWLWPDKILRWLIILAVVIGWAQAWSDLNLIIVNAKLEPIRYGAIASSKAVLALGVGVGLFYFGLDVFGILLGLLIGLLVSTLIAGKHWHDFSLHLSSGRWLQLFVNYGAPLTLTYMLTMVLNASDRFLLGWLMDARAVGHYAAAYDLSQQSLGMLMGVVHLAAFPLAVHALEEKGVAGARVQLRQNALILLAISVPATVGLVMLAANISEVILGAAFQENTEKIITLVALTAFVGGVRSYYFDYGFQLAGKIRGQIWVVVLAVIANFGLNLWWIPIWGVVGAAGATLIGSIVGLCASWYLGRKVFALPVFPFEAFKVVLASGGMAVVLFLTLYWRGPVALLEQVSLGCISYAFLLVILDIGKLRFILTRYLH
ncbi:MAG: oligosaccharide flippase family protein [Stenotrophobium sp.]